MKRSLLMPGAILLMFALTFLTLDPTPVQADYTPPDNTPGYTTVGSGGAKVQNQGSLTQGMP